MTSTPAANTAVLSLGSNLGDRLWALHLAGDLLQRKGDLIMTSASSVYETPPLGVGPENGPFLNQVLIARTQLSPAKVLVICRQVEEKLGRRRERPGQPRSIDIDLITCGSHILHNDNLQLPHPRYRERRFVLVPLKEAWPDFHDPHDGSTVDQLLEQCPDTSVLLRLIEDEAPR
ncbi:MAG: 2-amino-4-hydroxy-6-hydroxymethyldihydropteridine diphosphokinase [Candidatus Marinimicrobia bacterium]|nr:2-amino-4-hydroxy-6-hydroxymethyldihydropteridine diphosphokinase [Candidatus Neomarinimicrobiota bacterium]